MTEEWRKIPSQPGYEASSLGEVRSIDRLVLRANGAPLRLKGKVLKQHPATPDGRLAVSPSVQGRKHQTKLVHHLVAEAFHGPRPQGMRVLHSNGNLLDNRPGNLRYGTESDNRFDSVRHGTHVQARKRDCPRGHRYELWNLVLTTLPRERKCLACHRARNYCRFHPELDFVEMSHKYYAEIVAKAATAS